MRLMNLFSKWNVKMYTMCRHLSLFILFFSIGISIGNAKEQSNQERIRSLPSNTKYYNRLSEISVEKPQTHHRIRHQHTQQHSRHSHQPGHTNQHQMVQSSSFPDERYHHVHVNHNRHNKNNHQSNDSASYERSLPVTQRSNQFEKNNENNVAAARTNDLLSPQFRHTASHHIRTSKYDDWDRLKIKESSNVGHQHSYPNAAFGISSTRKNTHRIFPSRTMKTLTTTTTTTTTSTTTPAPVFHFIDKFLGAANELGPSNNYDDDDNSNDEDYDTDDYEEMQNENTDLDLGTKHGHQYSAFSQNDYFSNENIQQDDPIRNGRSPNLNINRVSPTTKLSINNDDNYSLEANASSQLKRSPTLNALRSSNDDVKTNSTARSLQTNGDGNAVGELTLEKFNRLGSQEAVRKEATAYRQITHQEKRRRANEHMQLIRQNGACKRPQPKLIPIGNHTSKTYYPHCTLLHRCSDETGCCESDSETCRPATIEMIDQYVFVHTFGGNNRRIQSIELLTFENHTDCHCVPKTSLPTIRVSRSFSRTTTTTTTLPPQKRCLCPDYFMEIFESRTVCRCDCSLAQAEDARYICNELKDGNGHFSIQERKCIMSERCVEPMCQYGRYDVTTGSCPRQGEERISLWDKHDMD